MLNSTLHRITNRNDFSSAIFAGATSYTPQPAAADCEAVRRLLCLDRTENDYYVVGLLAAVEFIPAFAQVLGGTAKNYDLTRWTRPLSSVTGGRLVPDAKGPPALHRLATKFPIDFTLTITYADATSVMLQQGEDAQLLPAVIGTDALFVTWPADIGISGGLAPARTWAPGSSVDIFSVPRNFPYAQVAEILKENSAAQRLLGQHGLVANFFTNPDPMERVATVLVALGLSTPEVA